MAVKYIYWKKELRENIELIGTGDWGIGTEGKYWAYTINIVLSVLELETVVKFIPIV